MSLQLPSRTRSQQGLQACEAMGVPKADCAKCGVGFTGNSNNKNDKN